MFHSSNFIKLFHRQSFTLYGKHCQKWCMYHIREHTVLLKANITLTHFLSIKYCFESIKLLVVACVNSNSHVPYAWWLYPLSIEHWSTQISALKLVQVTQSTRMIEHKQASECENTSKSNFFEWYCICMSRDKYSTRSWVLYFSYTTNM